jgi:hypothetical protein
MKHLSPEVLARWYTRIIGVYFVLIVLPLITDFNLHGFNPESMHKLFHILLGSIVLWKGWNSSDFQRSFPLINGAFFTYVALVGILFPNLGNLIAFNTTDTILHALVGLSGLGVSWMQNRNI